jgi:hypothetical protein
MTPAQTRIRSAATLAGLLVLLLAGVAWAWSAVSEPFPEREKAATCTSTVVSPGDKVYPDQVTVSVINGGTSDGLAGRTLTELAEAGLDRGELGNAPDAQVNVAQIWAEDVDNPAVRLVLSFLGDGAKVVRRDAPLPGVNVVVGEEFRGVGEGRKFAPAREEATICSPPVEDLS